MTTFPAMQILEDKEGYFPKIYLNSEELIKNIQNGFYKEIRVIKTYNNTTPEKQIKIQEIISKLNKGEIKEKDISEKFN